LQLTTNYPFGNRKDFRFFKPRNGYCGSGTTTFQTSPFSFSPFLVTKHKNVNLDKLLKNIHKHQKSHHEPFLCQAHGNQEPL